MQENSPTGPVRHRHRVRPAHVLRNLPLLAPGSTIGLGTRDDLALLAGCIEVLEPKDAEVEQRISTAVLMVGKDYAAGFRDGFNCERVSPRSSRRYVEGLDDGSDVGRAVRHAMINEESEATRPDGAPTRRRR